MKHKTPLISIVTVCYNAANDIEQTIQSVLAQTYDNTEYIIVDGGSTDGTVDIIRRYEKDLAYWVSEPDGGIYDAMNKGIKAVTGEYINFMNAGDEFSDNKVIECFCRYIGIENNTDIFYGDAKYVEFGNLRMVKAQKLSLIKSGMVFSHQSSFIKRELIGKRFYAIKYKFAADYDLFLYAYHHECKFTYVPMCIAKVIMDDGVTFDSFKSSKREALKIHLSYGYPVIKAYWIYFYSIVRYYVVRFIKKHSPKNLYYFLSGLK